MIATVKYYGLRTDLWSCGIILYAMLNGNLPFEDKDVKVLYNKILEEDYYDNPNLSSSARSIIKGLLTKKSELRIRLNEIKEHKFYKKVNLIE